MSKTATPVSKLTSADLQRLAEQAAEKEKAEAKQQRTDKFKKAAGMGGGRRLSTEQNLRVAAKLQEPQQKETERPSADQLAESKRKGMVRDRNRRRRRPWYATLAVLTLGLAGSGVAALLSGLGVSMLVVAAVFAAAGPVVALGCAWRMERVHRQHVTLADRRGDQPPEPTHRRWLVEVTLAGLGGGAVIFWIATSGVSALVVLTLLLGTVMLGARWWRSPQNALGVDVAPLSPPQPAPAPAPSGPAAAPVERDPYALAWKKLPSGFGVLTNRTADDNIIRYDIELTGEVTNSTVMKSTEKIAGTLGLDSQQVIVEPPKANEDGFKPANRARLTIIVRDVAAGVRHWSGPNVQMKPDGTAAVLTNLARFRDGQGEAQCTMWTTDGMVPTTIYGGTGSGKSAASNALTIGALSTGLLNSIYVDFKGNSSGMLRSRARIVVVGRDATTDVRKLLHLLTTTRLQNDPRDKQFPTADRPGWFLFIEEIAKGIKADPKFAQESENLSTTARSLGIWPVVTAHDMHGSAWAGTNNRAAWGKQAFVFYLNTSSDDLINGLTYRPSTLPTYDEDEAGLGQDEQPIPGFGVGVNTRRANVPAKWDWLPADDDPVDGDEPPWRAGAAWDAYVTEPGLTQVEYDALVAALGEPNADGRWIIGVGGTHRFRDEEQDTKSGTRRVRKSGFGTPRTSTDGDGDGGTIADPTQRHVYELIAAGTTRVADLETAMSNKASRATIDRALNALVGDQQIERTGRGEYAVVE
ncbi:hypothetical protein FHS23_004617 [Prauserella isguenensis]|uniref:FtsK domain-containing protein n=1 Tax=Prauserella isguenensis TaxID=1470180 RepID=A0A839S8G4_9PSEU|nr:hypothetical protein [Prauserella isguenensis]MBB3053563.1 hypothetical protein [Prauserella isguenensis]